MVILTLRTDNPQAEIGLYEDSQQLGYESWEAHRKLAETLHLKIESLVAQSGKTLADLEGVVMYTGPGSFTGLRIGLSVGNALGASYNLKSIGSNGDNWIADGISKLIGGKSEPVVLPEYGTPAFTTQQKK